MLRRREPKLTSAALADALGAGAGLDALGGGGFGPPALGAAATFCRLKRPCSLISSREK